MIREPCVAGSFYPASPDALRVLVDHLLEQARLGAIRRQRPDTASPLRGILVPHAGLEWSGVVAAAGWRALSDAVASSDESGDATIVILGTNHSAWLSGIGVWPNGRWSTPLGEVAVDPLVADAILGLGPPFAVNVEAHLREHSIEVQLPLLQSTMPGIRFVPLAVSAGTGVVAVDHGRRLGTLIASLDEPGRRVLLAISTDLAHYPPHRDCVRATEELLPSILGLDATSVARIDGRQRTAGIPGLVCGMCGIEPTVLGLAALGAMGATGGIELASATSADAGGPRDRTVGYLAAAFA